MTGQVFGYVAFKFKCRTSLINEFKEDFRASFDENPERKPMQLVVDETNKHRCSRN